MLCSMCVLYVTIHRFVVIVADYTRLFEAECRLHHVLKFIDSCSLLNIHMHGFQPNDDCEQHDFMLHLIFNFTGMHLCGVL